MGCADPAFSQVTAAPKRLVIDEDTTIQSISKQMGITGLRAGSVGDKKRMVDLNHDFSESAKSKSQHYFKWK
jgi:hypothetical protein